MKTQKEWIEFSKANKHFTIMFKKMCVIGKTNVYTQVKPWTKNWFLKFSWTEAQEDKFRIWMIDYLYNNLYKP